MTLHGIDISNWQQSIDWDTVAGSGKAFAFIKAAEDPAYKDPWFARNWRECKRVGMTRGAYHFAQPDQASPEQSVAHFAAALDAAGGLEPGDLIALDLEAGSGDLLAWTTTWLSLAAGRFGVVPVIYSGHWFLEPHNLEGHPELARYPLWVASYQDSKPPVPAGWDRYRFWQYSAHAAVPGVSGDCDVNEFDGTLDELRALGKPASAPAGFDYEAEFWGPVYAAAQRLKQTGIPRDTAAAVAAEHIAILHKERAA